MRLTFRRQRRRPAPAPPVRPAVPEASPDTASPARRRIPVAARLAVAVAVLVVVGEMAGGFAASWRTLYDAARHAGWAVPALLPAELDAPVLAYVILDQVAAALGARARGLRFVAWGLAGLSVWANYQLGYAPTPDWQLINAAMPAGWVAGTEGLRWFWGVVRRGPAPPKREKRKERDGIPLGRWIAAPRETRRIQWRMWHLGERSWKRMSLIEDMRAVALDVVREMEADGRDAPAYLAVRIDAARLPGAVLDAVDSALRYGSGTAAAEAAVRTWVADSMVLREQAAASLEQARDEVRAAAAALLPAAPEPQPAAAPDEPSEVRPEAAAGRTRGPRPDAPPAAPRKPAPKLCRETPLDAFGEMAGPWVAAQLETRPGLSVRALAADLKVGAPKARAALEAARELAGADRVVVQFGARQEAGAR